MSDAAAGWRQPFVRGLAVAAATACLCWPALWNGYPLLYADSLSYLQSGPAVVSELLGADVPYWMYASDRSEFYAVGIYLLHGSLPLWTIVVAQSALMAWVIWLVVRSVCPDPVRAYLPVAAGLSVLTGIAWYTSFVMPDCLSGILVLSFYLLLFWPKSLRRTEKVGLALAACWALTSHATHLVLGACIVAMFALLRMVRWPGMRGRGVGLLRLSGLLVVSALGLMAVHARLYGRASISGQAPPFLMARLLGDGPARWYLQQNCARLSWTICLHANDLPDREADFLWPSTGIWRSSTEEQQKQLRKEEMPLLLATLRSYPRQQAVRSWSNFVELLTTVGPWNFWSFGDLTPDRLDAVLPGLGAHYSSTKQAHSALPQAFFRSLQARVLEASMLIVVVLLPWAWYRRLWGLLGLAGTVLMVVPMNALLCGVISCNDPRLQDRIAWLLALLAGLLLAVWIQRRGVPGGTPAEELSGIRPRSS